MCVFVFVCVCECVCVCVKFWAPLFEVGLNRKFKDKPSCWTSNFEPNHTSRRDLRGGGDCIWVCLVLRVPVSSPEAPLFAFLLFLGPFVFH